MENLYVTFRVEVANDEYAYQGRHADAEMKIQVPRSVLQHIDAGDLFNGILAAALANFDAVEPKSEKESE